MDGVLASTMAMASLASSTLVFVSPQALITNPRVYEGRVFRICGAAPISGNLLFTGRTMGRSPVVIRLDRALHTRSRCIKAKLIRSTSTPSKATQYEAAGNAMDGPIVMKGWRLQVIRVVSRVSLG